MVEYFNNYEITKLNTKINIEGIYTIHYFKYGRNFNILPERHDFWELVFIDSGNVKILDNDKVITLTQSQGFLYKPNVLHTIYTDENFANSAIISFQCKSESLYNLAERVLTFSDYEKILLNKIVSETKKNFSDKLNDVYLNKMTKNEILPFGGEQIIKNCIELLLISLVRTNTFNNKVDEVSLEANKNSIVEGIIDILNSKLENTENVNLDEISYKLGFSKSYIKSQFKLKTGFSIIQYYIDMRIEKSKKLLSMQKYTISEISDYLGFGSVYYFSRIFKSHTHMTPTEYINSIKADNLL